MFTCKLYSAECRIKHVTDTVLSFVYAHGELQDKLGTDILCYNTQDQLLPMSPDYTEGIWPVTVVGNNGEQFQCVVFIWDKFKPMKQGLCVICGDVEATRYAAEQYATRAMML